ncbi:MAG: hypothetical protein ABWW65_00115 [Thermoprotei archaeon]
MLKLGVVKLTSCSGCLNEVIYGLLVDQSLRNSYRIIYFPELSDRELFEDLDIVLVEGSVSIEEQREFLKNVRSRSKFLVALGTCAVFGGIQSLRNDENLDVVKSTVYPKPEMISILERVEPVGEVVKVDLSIPGCPVNGDAVVSLLRKYANQGLPILLRESVCMECKRKGIECVLVAHGKPCLGLVTNAGCGALCPSFGRGCYGCFGLKDRDIVQTNLNEFLKVLKEKGFSEEDYCALIKGYGYLIYTRLSGNKTS